MDRPNWTTVPCKLSNIRIKDNGYAREMIAGKDVYTHRLSWEETYGPIPEGMLVLHHCDVRNCYEPLHLFLGTHADNTRDMEVKGRRNDAVGSKSSNAKLTEEQVLEIRQMLKDGNVINDIASYFGVRKLTIINIKYGRTWGWLE